MQIKRELAKQLIHPYHKTSKIKKKKFLWFTDRKYLKLSKMKTVYFGMYDIQQKTKTCID